MVLTSKVQIMGILNVTPDSFSDGGLFTEENAILDQIQGMLDAGVDIIDVGGESSRPFASAVSLKEELNRVVPVIKAIRSMTTVPISIDTTKAVVAAESLAAGADIINDISALRVDPGMINVVRSYSGPIIIMHMQGTPQTMQLAPHYDDILDEINSFFTERIAWLEAKDISRERIVIDPGVGFGKTLEHNIKILKNIPSFKRHGCQVLIGHSRKSFIEKITGAPVSKRDCPSAVISAYCATNGADILRVHDVEKTTLALQVYQHLIT